LLASLLILGLAAGAYWLARPVETLSGPARVIDGDTIELAGQSLRLAGLDAPELNQTCERGALAYRCGETARDALRALARADALTCRIEGRDRYGRGLARCEAGGVDLGASLVRRGLAVAYGSYAAEEAEARAGGLGVWAGPFERPADWRRNHPRQAAGPPS
jgi:endonuclease YncB( thermonuclease family)